MTPGIETEIKTPYTETLARKIGVMAARPTSVEVLEDLYLDTPDHRLFRAGIFVRVRNGRRGEVKYVSDSNDLSHSECEEYPFPYPMTKSDRKALQQLLQELYASSPLAVDRQLTHELVEFVRIRKERKNFDLGNLTCSVDDVQDLGRFIELEARNAEGIADLRELIKQGAVSNMPIGYVEMWLRQHDFAEYLRGRYVMPADREVQANAN